MSRVSDSRGIFVLSSTIRFASRHLDIAALLGDAINRSPMLQECDRALLRFSLRSIGSAPDLSMRPRALAAHDEKPPWTLPVFYFILFRLHPRNLLRG